MTTCSKCGATLRQGLRFCTQCREPVPVPKEPAVSEENLAEYEQLLAEFGDDGVLDAEEMEELEAEREELGIPDSLHRELVSRLNLFEGNPLQFEYDASGTKLRPGKPSNLMLCVSSCLKNRRRKMAKTVVLH